MDMPTTEQEVWRYSRIGELQLDRFHPAAASTTVHGANGYLAERHELDTSAVHDIFDELAGAFHSDTVLSIPRGQHVASPIVVTHTVRGDDEATFPRLVVDAGENSEVTVVERFVSDGSGSADGAITSYGVLVSTDGATFTEATSGSWAADGKMKWVTFGPVAARYVRLEARAANGAAAVATEVTVGAKR